MLPLSLPPPPLPLHASYAPHAPSCALIRLASQGGYLEGRRKLVTAKLIPWNIFNNAAGFLRVTEVRQ